MDYLSIDFDSPVVFYVYDMHQETDIVYEMIKHIRVKFYDMIVLDYNAMKYVNWIFMIYDMQINLQLNMMIYDVQIDVKFIMMVYDMQN